MSGPICSGSKCTGVELFVNNNMDAIGDNLVFKRFYNPSTKRSDLNKTILRLCLGSLEGFNGFLLRPMKILAADIAFPVNFSGASVYFLESDELPFAVGIGFELAYTALSAYYHKSRPDDPCLPKNKGQREALRRLLLLLERLDEVFDALQVDNVPERELTLRLAQHVFSQLSPCPTYKCDINNQYALSCSCKNKEETFYGLREDTSFGWDYGWHGSADIIMADVAVLSDSSTSEACSGVRESVSSSCSGNESSVSVEVKKKANLFSYKKYGHIAAETIAFSFLINQNRKDGDITMIPSIAVSPETVQVNFYDSVKDVFIQSAPMDFVVLERRQIDLKAILLIWLTLNYKQFMTMNNMEVKSGLHQLIDVDKFQRDIKSPCHSVVYNQQWVTDDEWKCDPDVDMLREDIDETNAPATKYWSELDLE